PDGRDIVRPLSPKCVQEILGRFRGLNPYEGSVVPELWKAEHDSLRWPLTCYAISAKRYVLYREGSSGREVVQVGDAPEQASFDDIPPEEGDGLVDWS